MTVREKIKSGQTGEWIASVIRQRILNWEYPPNHPLGEAFLSEEFGVSRSPVREALRSLESESLIKRVPNRGYYVRQFNLQEMAELYDVRLALELFAVEYLARTPSLHPNVLELARLWTRILEGDVPNNAKEFASVDQAFHEGLCRLTGNSMLLESLSKLNERLQAFRTMDFANVLETNSVKESCHGHLAIVEAIVAGDTQKARDTMRDNLTFSRANVDKAMGKILIKAFDT